MKNVYEILEFNVILQNLADNALSDKAKKNLLSLTPILNERECRLRISETTYAKEIIECAGTPPIASMKELDKVLYLAEKGSMLSPEQLENVCVFLSSCKRMQNYLKKVQHLETTVVSYAGAFNLLEPLYDEIERSIRNGNVDDSASTTLRDIRRKIENVNTSIKTKLESILRSKKEWFVEGYVATRNGRLVLPVKKEYKNQISGTVVDTSGKGGTCFIEPSSVRKLQEELSSMKIDEDNEIRKILYTLTEMVDSNNAALKINADCMETLDFIFAKAKLSLSMSAVPATVHSERMTIIKQGRHPLLKESECVPLDFQIGKDIRGVVVTGPNTGGKTVALKTVGLLSMMAQSGLHVPVGDGSVFSMYCNYLCDIGDGQSITENLSTFSSHITNIINILRNTSEESLVLLDELGSGTDPAEGMGIAVAILDELRIKNCIFVATTHYPEIKEFAKNTVGLINARMEFDRESLKPLYKLLIGEAGESCALYIAQRLGFPYHMLERARKEAYNERKTEYRDIDLNIIKENIVEERVCINKIKKESTLKEVQPKAKAFNLGDSVMVYPQRVAAIVYQTANEKGDIGVQIQNEKQLVNHKRLKLIAPASEMYPADYDFSIVFDTVKNRKAVHSMQRKHDPNIIAEYNQ